MRNYCAFINEIALAQRKGNAYKTTVILNPVKDIFEDSSLRSE